MVTSICSPKIGPTREPGNFFSDPLSFNIWLPLTRGWTRSAFIGHVRSYGVGVVASDAFTVEGPPSEAVRVGLGGPISRDTLKKGLEFMGHSLEASPELASAFF
jgi:DNA-binding transcriptional MocR family regulator